MPYTYDRTATDLVPTTFGAKDYAGIEAAFGDATRSQQAVAVALLKKSAKVLSADTGYPFTVSVGQVGGARISNLQWYAKASNGPVWLSVTLGSQLQRMHNGLVIGPLRVRVGLGFGGAAPEAEVRLEKMPTMRDVKAVVSKVGLEKIIHKLGGPLKGRQTGPINIGMVEKFIATQRTYFDLEDQTSTSLDYTTRDDGDVGEGQAGQADIQHARDLVKAVRAEFGAAVKVGIEVVDEWVTLRVTVV